MGRLVDYSSDDSDTSAAPTPPVAKKRKTAQGPSQPETAALPPLPASFHDLYASTVRVSAVDDPSLHQGRKRQIPHVAGNWPTHLYIEWHPTSAEEDLLTILLVRLTVCIASCPSLESMRIYDCLKSDLGVPLPLHISLSRPLSLTTAAKDSFLAQLWHKIRSCPVAPFALRPRALEWHRTADSARSFLVLRVARAGPETEAKGEAAAPARNAELTALLRRCNDLAEAFQQPALYAYPEPKAPSRNAPPVDDAFHVTLAWTFDALTPELLEATREAFAFGPRPLSGRVGALRIPVDGIKAKIGNVVTHVQLPERGGPSTY